MSSVETATLFPVDAEEYGRLEYRRKVEPEAEFDGDLWIWKGEAWNWEDLEYELLLAPPYHVGQVLAIQEEWCYGNDGVLFTVVGFKVDKAAYYLGSEYGCRFLGDVCEKDWASTKDWQPASTLPLWAVRKWERVTEVSVDGGEWVVRTQGQERE